MEEEKKVKVNEEEQEEPVGFWYKAKLYFNRAQFSRYVGFLFVLTATVVISLYQVGWDPTKIGWQRFVSNTALLIFLGVYGLFFGEGEGTNIFKKMITGAYQVARKAFLDVVDKIINKKYTDALPDYIVWRYERDYENACKIKMLSVRITKEELLNLPDEELEQLKHKAIKYNDKYYSKISEDQYKIIRDIKDGKVYVDYIDDYTFFLNDENTDGEQQATKVKNTQKRKEKITWKQRLTRLGMIVIVALIFAGFFKEMYEGDDGTQEAIRTLVSRISTLVVSIASGINTARLLNLEDVFVLKYKQSYDELFCTCMENGTFKPADYDEKAKAEYEEQERKEAEAIAKVIDPEVIDNNKDDILKLEEPYYNKIEHKGD